jgi:alkylation response protein AidB-like acyl-CoA dehydrogenase
MKVHARYQPIPDAASRAKGDALVAWLRSYGERRINSRLIDDRRTIPPYVALDFGNQGILGMQVEERFGGLGLRSREVARVLEQAAALDLALGTWVLVCLFPGVRPIAAFANEALRREILPQLAAGRVLAGFAQTEPGAGTHFQGMAARALRSGEGRWRITGDKIWIGNATWAGVLTVIAHDVDGEGRRRGLSAFAVRTDAPGVVLGHELLSLGMRGVVQSEVGFRDVVAEAGDVLGEPENGLDVAVDSMSWSRFAIAATCIGSQKRCAQLMLRFGARRQIATGKLADHPLFLARLGEAAARAATAESVLYRVAAELDGGGAPAIDHLAVAKVIGSEYLCRTADDLVQVLGSRGYDEENLAPQLLRDARVTRIFEGTSDALHAYLGQQAVNPGSEIYRALRDDLAADPIADELEAAIRSLRGRASSGSAGGALARGWQLQLAGQAACAALAAASVAADLSRAPSPQLEHASEWARRELASALARAAQGGPEEAALLPRADLEKAVAAFADSIGDVDQHLPGGRIGLDPILRRDPAEG